MEDRISPQEEQRLAAAIESAAARANIDDKADRNEVLASFLKKANVDARFAKVASALFNKRITVLTLRKTADDHKADPFALTDADTVYNLVAGEPQEKAASVMEPMRAALVDLIPDGYMEKAASEETPKRIPYEYTVTMENFQKHLTGMLEKYAARMTNLKDTINSLEGKVEKETEEVVSFFKKAAENSYDFTTAVNVFGSGFEKLVKKAFPDRSYEQTAPAIRPNTNIFKKIGSAVQDSETLESLKLFQDAFSTGLFQLTKAASELGKEIQKYEYHGLFKKADAGTQAPAGPAPTPPTPPTPADPVDPSTIKVTPSNDQVAYVGGAMMPLTAGALGSLVAFPTGLAMNTLNSFGNVMSNARNMYLAGTDVGASPAAVIDSNFLTRDRYRDRLLSWSDMSADPTLALYPAEQVFQATQKAMDMDSSLERPDRREVLRTQVAQLLAQNGRASTADMAALATTLRYLAAAEPGAVQDAATNAKSLSKEDRPVAPAIKNPFEGLSVKDWDKLVADSTKAFNDEYKGYFDQAEANKGKAEKEQQAEAKKQDAANKKTYEAEKKTYEAEQAKVTDYNNQMAAYKKDMAKAIQDLHIRPRISQNTGKTEYWEVLNNKGKVTKTIPNSTAVSLINDRIADPQFDMSRTGKKP